MLSKSRFSLLILTVLILVGSLSILSGGVAAQSAPAPGCPAGQGYWKNTATWPVASLTLGSQSYSQAELLILLNTPGGDASMNLASQLTAAKLNVANGADAAVVSGLIAQADALLSAHTGKLPYGVDPASSEGQTMLNLAGVLDAYNNGQLSASCLTLTPTPSPENTPEATPEATPDPDDDDITITITIVIEGPVEEINVNIITIFGIDIEIDPDNDLLDIIQIGDIVHVEGTTDDMDGVIIIIAINIIIINVDINIDTGEIWRDHGNCDNPPPPWAPAHGWHRRCDDIIIIIPSDGGSGKGMGMGEGSN